VYLDNSLYKISRHQAFKISSGVMILSSIFTLVTKVTLGYFSASVSSLLIATISGYFFNALCNNLALKTNNYKFTLQSYNIKHLYLSWRLLIKEKDYALYRTPQSLAYYLSDSLPLLIIGANYSMAEAGLFGVAKTIVDLPMKLFFSSFAQVLTPFFSKKAHANVNITKLCVKIMLFGIIIVAPLFFVAYYLIPILFSILFSNEWAGAIIFSQYLLLASFGIFICLPAISILPIIGKQKTLYYFELIMLIIKTIIIGYVLTNPVTIDQFVYMISLTNFIGYLILFVYFIVSFTSNEEYAA
jgi:O-antigen/teichoic acid export membrane protein